MSLPMYPEYKDSGIRWLGEVPAHWEVVPLKHSFQIVGGSTPKSEKTEYWDGSIVWVSPADLSKLTSIYIDDSARKITDEGLASCGTTLVPIGSVVLSTRAPIGSLAIAATNLCTNQGCKALVPSNAVNSRFFAYVLLSATDELNIRGRGTTFLELSADELGAFKATRPSSDEQTAIATFLDRETGKIDALIAEQEKLLALLAEKRQATISHAVTKGLNPDVLMKDSGVAWLGEVPGHWEVLPLKRLLADVKAGPFGSALTKDMYVPAGYRVYGQEQVIPADFTIGDYYIDDKKFAELQQYAVKAGDILISCVGTFGKIAIVPASIEPGIINPRLIRLRVLSSLSAQYLEAVLRSSVVFEQFSMVSRGGTMDVINIGTLNAVTLAVPPITEQDEILSFINTETTKLDALKTESERAIALLKERRSALIAAAVTGQIDVRGLVTEPEAT